jgi:hypothetical protein
MKTDLQVFAGQRALPMRIAKTKCAMNMGFAEVHFLPKWILRRKSPAKQTHQQAHSRMIAHATRLMDARQHARANLLQNAAVARKKGALL